MTNAEKYKTAAERDAEFNRFCTVKECRNCEIGNGMELSCSFAWLELEAEEKPLPCPFCGSRCLAIDGSKIAPDRHGVRPYSYVKCEKCGYEYDGRL